SEGPGTKVRPGAPKAALGAPPDSVEKGDRKPKLLDQVRHRSFVDVDPPIEAAAEAQRWGRFARRPRGQKKRGPSRCGEGCHRKWKVLAQVGPGPEVVRLRRRHAIVIPSVVARRRDGGCRRLADGTGGPSRDRARLQQVDVLAPDCPLDVLRAAEVRL